MSLLPVFNYIENHANKYPNVKKNLLLIASNIVVHDRAEAHNAELNSFLRRNIMEYYTFDMLAEHYIKDKLNHLNIERAAETAFSTFFKLCEQIKRFDFEGILESNMGIQEIQMQNCVADIEICHEQEAHLVAKMNNRKIAHKLRSTERRNYDSLLVLAKIKWNMQNVRKSERQKLAALKMKRNEQIVHLLQSLKETQRLKQKKCNYQCKRSNIATLSKLKTALLLKYDEMKRKELGLLTIAQIRNGKKKLYTDTLYGEAPALCLLNMYPKTENEINGVQSPNNQENEIKAKPESELKSILQKNVNGKLHLLADQTLTKQVKFLLPEPAKSVLPIKTNFEKTIETNEVHVMTTKREENTNSGKLQKSSISDDINQPNSSDNIEILECLTLTQANKVLSDPKAPRRVEYSQSSLKPKQSDIKDPFNELESNEIVATEPKAPKNFQKLKESNEFTKYILMNTAEEANGGESDVGGKTYNNEENTSNDLFFGSESIVNVDCIANHEKMFDLSGSEIESNTICNNFF